MTRINLVPPSELCDQHLLAEHRELTRIPNAVVRGRYDLTGQPADYKLGAGHVKFFYDKMAFLAKRYFKLHDECRARGFKVVDCWPHEEASILPVWLWKEYSPTPTALAVNRARIAERMPVKPRFTSCKPF